MSVLELKKSIFVRLLENEDFQTLKKISDLLGKNNDSSEGLSEEQQQRLEEAYKRRNDVDGKITHEELMKKYTSWIEK